ncbi:MAG TPA: EamA family transporter [Flavitalea sp.]|nr:EamA family transporter [Flavitalea sp.]
MKNKQPWLAYAILNVVLMGVWGAFIEIPEKNGFPATMGYVVWSITMIPAAIFILKLQNWKVQYDRRSVLFGMSVGLLGSIGQLALFFALRIIPAYLVFPVIALTPLVTILLAILFLKENTRPIGWLGIALAIIAIVMLSYQPPGNESVTGYLWLVLSAIPLLTWGIQGFIMRWANETTTAESIFFWMMISAVVLSPIAIVMTDFSQPINWGFDGLYLTAIIQFLNAIGALFLVYAFRYGKAIVVSPLTTALAPVLTVVISLIFYKVIPHPIIITGITLAILSAFFMAMGDTQPAEKPLEQTDKA